MNNTQVENVQNLAQKVGHDVASLNLRFEALAHTLDGLNAKTQSQKGWLDVFYPVGAIYMNYEPLYDQEYGRFDPNKQFGGIWQKLKDVFLFASGDNYKVGQTGGAASHILTIDEMPVHNHTQSNFYNNTDALATTMFGVVSSPISSYATGSGKPHNNMPPYCVVDIWQRMA